MSTSFNTSNAASKINKLSPPPKPRGPTAPTPVSHWAGRPSQLSMARPASRWSTNWADISPTSPGC